MQRSMAVELLESVLGLTSLAELRACAGVIARRTGARGVVIWELAPTLRIDAPNHSRKLSVLASWFAEGDWPANTSLVSGASRVGRAVLHDAPTTVDIGARGEPLEWPNGHAPSHAYVVPFVLGARREEPGGIAAYFDSPPEGTATDEVVAAAEAFPCVYASVAKRPALAAAELVNTRLRSLDAQPRHPSVGEVQAVLDEISNSLAHHLRCMEAAIFLNLAPDGSHPAWVQAATVEGLSPPRAGKGVMGWVLKNRRPVWLPNAAHACEQESLIEARYPGLLCDVQPSRLCQVDEGVAAELRARQRRADPVLSWAAVPVVAGTNVAGVIRLSLALDEPSHFSERELHGLTLVADLLGRFWNTWTQATHAHDTLKGIADLNATAHTSLAPRVPPEANRLRYLVASDPGLQALLDRALERLEELVPRSTISSVRVLDAADRADRWLQYAAFRGAQWTAGTPSRVRERRAQRFAVDRNEPSLGRLVVVQKKTLVVDDVNNPGRDLACQSVFPDITYAMMCVPILLGDQVLGVLDLRSTAPQPFTPQEVQAAEAFAAQLGLYLGLAEAFHRQSELVEGERKMVEDLVHQLRSPLHVARLALGRVARTFEKLDAEVEATGEQLTRDVRVADRALAKAATTSGMAKLFRELADPAQNASTRATSLSPSHLSTVLRQAVDDAHLLTDPDRHVKYEVRDRPLFSCSPTWFDEAHLQECFSQMLDNARKYAYDSTSIILEAARADGWASTVTVISIGVPLDKAEVDRVVERGWRSENARFFTAEGQGIGMYVVSRLAAANGGAVRVRVNGDVTRVELCLPRRPKGG